MAFQIIPNTESEKVALVAIAWEIVEKSVLNNLEDSLPVDERKRLVTNAFIEVYQAILNSRRIGEDEEVLIEGGYLFTTSESNDRLK